MDRAQKAESIESLKSVFTDACAVVVTHNLGQQFTQVTVIDSTNQAIIPDSVTFDSANQLTVVFSSAINCNVVVSAPKIA